MGQLLLNYLYYYNLDFDYAFYTRGLNIRAQFNSKSCPIPYELEVGRCPPVIGVHVYYMYTPV